MSAGLPADFRRRFLGTHFFNPPRYLKLLELIPGPETDPAVLAEMEAFADRVLGKGVVRAKDTPNFIGNRIGSFGLGIALREMMAADLTIEEVDALTGPAIGRAKSATFRTADLAGVDVALKVSDNVYAGRAPRPASATSSSCPTSCGRWSSAGCSATRPAEASTARKGRRSAPWTGRRSSTASGASRSCPR